MPAVLYYVLGFVIALTLALILTPLVKKFAHLIGAVDVPNARKVHTRIMPRLGGLAIYLGFIGSFFAIIYFLPNEIMSPFHMKFIKAVLVGGTIIVITGALDDRFELPAKLKFLLQIAAACVVVFVFDVQINFVNMPFGSTMQHLVEWISIPITILWIVGVTNAINLIDGLDGLAAGVSGISILTILIMAVITGMPPVVMLSALLIGSIAGFMKYNFHPAKIFMGDSGSLFLGFCISMLSLYSFKQVTLVSFVIPLLIIGVPLSDTFFAIIRRLVNNKPIFGADKGHLHHRLQDLGLSHRKTVLVIWGISALFGAVAIIQGALITNKGANWITFAVMLIIIFLLQVGAEFIGIVDKTRKPVISMLNRLIGKEDKNNVHTESKS